MSFDSLAPHYRWLEWLSAGEKLQRCRVAFLHKIPRPAAVLIYGEGNGRFLTALCRHFPGIEITVVDASARMLSLARQRLQRAGLESPRVRFVHADALEWRPPAAAFDLIVTCFFLDCFDPEQLQRLVPRIAAAATPQACWLLADFQIARSGWRRMRSRFILALLYAFFRRATRIGAHALVNPAPLLGAEGFQRMAHQEHDHGLLFSSMWRRGDCVANS